VSGALVACAQAGDRPRGGGGNPDLSGGGTIPGPPDLSGTVGAQPDFAGIDLYGVDLTGFASSQDLAVNCNVYTQSGCGTNEKCTFGPQCLADGTVATGAQCGSNMGADDCIHGNICLSNPGSTISDCRQFCLVDGDCKESAAGGVTTNLPRCLLQVSDGPALDAGVLGSVCTVACNAAPAAGALGCAMGLNCSIWDDNNKNQFTDCGTAGAVGDGGDCTTNGNYDCTPGYNCVAFTMGTITVNHCRKGCRQGLNGDCPGGYGCVSPSGNNVMYGFCCPGGSC
jgi:hypothetical protein